MTRIEKNIAPDTKVEKLETEINRLKKGLKRKRNKKLLSCGSCLIIMILLIILGAGFLAYVLAKSGLKQIPYLTERLYQEPTPSYLVEVNDWQEQPEIFEIFKEKVIEQSLAQKKVGEFSIYLDLPEELLTSLIREKIRENSSLDNKIDYVQIAVLEDKLELFVKNKPPSNLILILNIKPAVRDSKLYYEIESLQAGNLQLPHFLAKIILSPVFGILNKALGFYDNYGQISNIDLAPGYISLEIFINKVLDFN